MKKSFFVLLAAGASFYGASHFKNESAEAAPIELVPRHERTEPATVRDTKPDKEIVASARVNVDQAAKNNLFAATSWLPPTPPPPPPPKIAAASPPQAPPVPFSFVGLLEDRTKPTAFLAHGDALLIVDVGDTLAGTYRVDAINTQEIALTYLPLKQRQLIRIPGE